MAKKKLLCPREDCRCEIDMKELKCKECSYDLKALLYRGKSDPHDLIKVLTFKGAFINDTLKELTIPLGHKVFFTIALSSPQVNKLSDFHDLVCRMANLSPDVWKGFDAKSLIDGIREGEFQLPKIKHFGDKPTLPKDKDENLFWPKCNTPVTKCIHELGLYYTGPTFEPRRTGVFEEWLASFKCSTEQDRQVLRGWLLATMVQFHLRPGNIPMLLICAKEQGAGKSSTADMIAEIVGTAVSVNKKMLHDMSKLSRVLMDPKVRVVIIDNMVPNKGEAMIDEPDLSLLITKKDFNVVALYQSSGTIIIQNRVLFIGTSNSPAMIQDLTGRSVVCTIDKHSKVADPDWFEKWVPRREEILADMAAICIENWNKEMPEVKEPRSYRYSAWFRTVALLTQQQPILYPEGMALVPPIQIALDMFFNNCEEAHGGEATLEQLVARLRSGYGAFADLSSQTDWCMDQVLSDMEIFPVNYELFTKGGELCVRRKSVRTGSETLSG